MKKTAESIDDETVVMADPTPLPAAAPGRGLRYVGQEYIHGVPARDLTPEEAVAFAERIQANHAATGRILYEEL